MNCRGLILIGLLGTSSGLLHADGPQAPLFLPTVVNPGKTPGSAPKGMVWIPGGEFSMGCNDPRSLPHGGHEPMEDCRPIHRVYLDGFLMDKTDVTNEEFEQAVSSRWFAERVFDHAIVNESSRIVRQGNRPIEIRSMSDEL